MPPRRTATVEPVGPEDTDAPEEKPLEGASALKAFIDVFHEDWQALPLAAKLAKIAGTLENIPKKGWNPNQNYKFARETDLVAAIRPYLAAAGILITFSVVKHEIIVRPNPDAKGMLTHVTLTWAATDGKETITGLMDGYGADTGDKGVYKAITGAKKYVLMTLFLIDTGDDPEAEPKEKQPQQVGQIARQVVRPRNSTSDYIDDMSTVDEQPPPVVSPLRRTDIVRGGHTTGATDTQHARLIEAIRVKAWTGLQVLAFLRTNLGAALVDAPEDDPARLRTYIVTLLDSLSPENMGQLIVGIESGE